MKFTLGPLFLLAYLDIYSIFDQGELVIKKGESYLGQVKRIMILGL